MKRTKVKVSKLSLVIPALATSAEFLSIAAPAIDITAISESHYKRVIGWCLKYWDRYHKAPGRHLESIFFAWSEKGKVSDEEVDSTRELLEYLSVQSEAIPEPNVPYLVDVLGEYIQERKLEKLKDEIEYSLVHGDVPLGESAVGSFSTIAIGERHAVDPFQEESIWDEIFAESQDPLFTWRGKVANRFFGNAFVRDSLTAMLAPEKRGKTWWCIEILMRGLMAKRKVAVFEVGDMSKTQIMKRVAVRLAGLPMYQKQLGDIYVPDEIVCDANGPRIVPKMVHARTVVSAASAREGAAKFLRRYALPKKEVLFRLSVHSTGSASVSDIRGVLTRWELEDGYIPDVIVIDYPDILAPEPSTSSQSTRDQENGKWKALRRLSLETHTAVFVPTQADSAAYSVDTLGMSNFSEDKRKAAHVTGMLGLNQTSEEKEKGLCRLNWIFLREGEYSINRCLTVGQCLSLGRAFCCAGM